MIVKNKARNAFEEARELYNNIEGNKKFVRALYYAQLLEFYIEILLDSCVNIVDKKINDGYICYSPKIDEDLGPKERLSRNKTFFEKVDAAIQNRNDFIHNCFRRINENGKGISLDIENVHLDPESKKIMEKWMKSFLNAGPLLVSKIFRIQRTK